MHSNVELQKEAESKEKIFLYYFLIKVTWQQDQGSDRPSVLGTGETKP